MEPISSEEKTPIVKSLAVAGLIGIIVFIAWAAIQIVQIFPTALTSLASLANSVYNYNPNITRELEVSSNETMVNANESMTLSWKNLELPGSYTFSFECTDGLALDLKTEEKTYSELTCNKSYELGNVSSAEITTYSNQNRFVDLKYKIEFFRTNATTATAGNSGFVTIINEGIKLADGSGAELPKPEIPTEPTPPVEVIPEPEPAPVEPVATTTPPVKEEPKPVTPTTKPKPVTVTTPTYIYEIPVSKPNGTTDLVASYIGIGKLYTNGIFNNTGVVYYNEPGTMQFSVQNVGSKTSDTWTFEAKLPGNITYTSSKQEPLKPNERAVLSLNFPAIKSTDTQYIYIKVNTNSDTNYATNQFSQTVLVLR